jgi:hypothetical protein
LVTKVICQGHNIWSDLFSSSGFCIGQSFCYR